MNEQSSELKKFLSVSTAAAVPQGKAPESRRVAEFSLSSGTVEVPEDAPEGKALNFLEAAGQSPDEWEVTGFRRIEYGNPGDPFISTRFTYKRRSEAELAEHVDIDDLLYVIEQRALQAPEPSRMASDGPPGGSVLIGDMQFGQGIEDPFEAIENSLSAIDGAAEKLEAEGGVDELLVAWLGDHVEGFVSQGGANTWRTKLTLSEQVRATRRVMLYAVERFYPLTDRLVVAAVPGNHGESQRIAGKGVTTYTDNHDVEALNAVAESLSMSSTYSDVEVYVPERDEVSLAVRVGGVVWGLVHGEKWRAGKQWEWWEQQTFHGGPVAAADVLCCGHWHTLWIQEQGRKTFIQVPTLGTDGMWWAHAHGARPHPGLVVALTDGEEVSGVFPIRAV